MTDIIGVIPAHLASIRFPKKILHDFYGLPMIEHVRRRALLSHSLSKVYVATCDEEIASAVSSYGGDVIKTASTHTNGTSRVAEAVKDIDCSHVLLLQGDEPLLLPSHVDLMVESILNQPTGEAWNATAYLSSANELERHSFVKCSITKTGQINLCFRKSPFYAPFEIQRSFVRKILGLIAYNKKFLLEITQEESSLVETSESIEQLRIIDNDSRLQSVEVSPALPSVNEPGEVDLIYEFLNNSPEQQLILRSILES